jgi:YQGE family putative transporter
MSKLGKMMMGKIEVSKDLKLLLLIGGLYSLSVALSNTFVNVYLWKQKSDYTTIALFNLFIVVAQPIVFVLAGRWAKQIDRIIVLRLGVFFLSVFYMVVLLLGSLAAKYAILLGALLGVGFGFYWLAFNVLTFEITEPETRDIFNGFFGLLGSFAGMIGPFLAGWIITKMKDLTGYTLIFGISLGLFITAVILSFFLKRRSAAGKFQLLHVIRWNEVSSNWKRILLGNAAQGLREGSFPFLITIWIFVAAGSELALGTFSLITSAISFVFYYIVGRFVSKKFRKASILISSILLSAAVWIIAFHLSFPKLMTYGVVVSIAYPILMVPLVSMTYDIIGKAKKAAEWRIEYVVARELFLNAGRIISILFFISTILLFEAEKALPYFIIILGNAQMLLYFFIRKIEI